MSFSAKKDFGNIYVYDTETTGLQAKTHGVCEIAFIVLDSLTLVEVARYEAIIAPYKNPESKVEIVLDQRALDVNGFTESKIRKQGRPVKEVAAEIVKFISTSNVGKKKPILAGHNIIKFDNPMFESMMKAGGKDISKLFELNRSFDSLHWANLKWPSYSLIENHKLGTVVRKHGRQLFDGHRAMADTEANAEVIKDMIKAMRSEGGSLIGEASAEKQEDKFRSKFQF